MLIYLQGSGSEVKWVDGGKSLFRLKLQLVSTVNTEVCIYNSFKIDFNFLTSITGHLISLLVGSSLYKNNESVNSSLLNSNDLMSFSIYFPLLVYLF